MVKISKLVILLLSIISIELIAQEISGETPFTRQDTLRGSITPERVWWDLNYYHLDISINPDNKTIKGKNTIGYTVLKKHDMMQIDLQEPLIITSATQNNTALEINRDGNAYFIKLEKTQNIGDVNYVIVEYEGEPKEAVRAPWDGGFSWEKDENGNHFIATSCQGLGASVWWPNKDHMYDEVDSMLMSINVPNNLMNVSNGRLREVSSHDDNTTTYHWFVSNPINNYGVNVNIGDYVKFSEIYDGEKGKLDVDYYVLRYNLEKAKIHFMDVPKMLDAFEHWFGPYPFYEDGYKLVEVPYLGMEHQSSITYGNKYLKGYLGRDPSNTGWGLKFDFIIISSLTQNLNSFQVITNLFKTKPKNKIIQILEKNNDFKHNFSSYYLKKPLAINKLLLILSRFKKNKLVEKKKFNLKNGLVFEKFQRKLLSIKKKKELILTEKESEILEYLLKEKKFIKKRDLLKNIWGFNSKVKTRTLETHIYRLRKKINKNFGVNKFINVKDNSYKLF